MNPGWFVRLFIFLGKKFQDRFKLLAISQIACKYELM
jgi:hypothetical protein